MKKKINLLDTFVLLNLLLVQFLSFSAFAQGTNNDLDALVSDTKTDLMTVVGGGLAGAVLGLSTLSFVDEPKDHTRNIIVGASLGIIFGVGYVAFSQASKTQDLIYGTEQEMQEAVSIGQTKDFNTVARNSWHHEQQFHYINFEVTPYQVNYKLRF